MVVGWGWLWRTGGGKGGRLGRGLRGARLRGRRFLMMAMEVVMLRRRGHECGLLMRMVGRSDGALIMECWGV
jgi:hypothetical protein